jgi:hypothetical protein
MSDLFSSEMHIFSLPSLRERTQAATIMWVRLNCGESQPNTQRRWDPEREERKHEPGNRDTVRQIHGTVILYQRTCTRDTPVVSEKHQLI